MRNPFGWDLPPGVSTSMLPGNSREDIAKEAMYDQIYNVLDQYKGDRFITIEHDSDRYHDLATKIADLIGKSWKEGYDQGMADEQRAQQILSANISYKDY